MKEPSHLRSMTYRNKMDPLTGCSDINIVAICKMASVQLKNTLIHIKGIVLKDFPINAACIFSLVIRLYGFWPDNFTSKRLILKVFNEIYRLQVSFLIQPTNLMCIYSPRYNIGKLIQSFLHPVWSDTFREKRPKSSILKSS